MGAHAINAKPDHCADRRWSPDEQAILDVVNTESAAYFSNDFETLAAQWLHTAEAIRMFAGPRVGVRQHKGWDQIGKGFRKSMEWAPQHYDAREYLDRQNIQISISGDMAWVHYDQVLAKNDPDFITDALQHETKILHRVDGRWRIACMILVVPEKAQTTSPEIRLDDCGRVVQLNDAAKARLPDFRGLTIVGDRLRAGIKDMNPAFQVEISKRCDFLKTMFGPGLVNRSAHPIPLGEDDYARPMYCWIRVVQNEISVTFDDASALEVWTQHAAELFALSASQRRLVVLLLNGSDLREISDSMGVQLSTTKTQLRRIFEKTGTNSQNALITRLMSVRKPG